MTFRVAGLDEIKRWALSFGPEANLLKPEKPEDFDLLKRFCYDAVNFGFPLQPFPWIKTQVASLKRGTRMRGDQLARQWRIIRTIEAHLRELIATKL
jgi:hypothetical protein